MRELSQLDILPRSEPFFSNLAQILKKLGRFGCSVSFRMAFKDSLLIQFETHLPP
jgi:hypothetical protein